MRIIPSKFHGVLDYAVAVTLIGGPLLLGFDGPAKSSSLRRLSSALKA